MLPDAHTIAPAAPRRSGAGRRSLWRRLLDAVAAASDGGVPF